MTDASFEDWLRKGLGRAGVQLELHGGHDVREALVYGCTHHLSFTPYEESRAPYLWTLIQLSSDSSFYRDAILSVLGAEPPVAEGDEPFHLGQVFELAARFVREGDDAMKLAMYLCFETTEFDGDAAEVLVSLDGMDALSLAAKKLADVDAEDRPPRFASLVHSLEEFHGKMPLPPELGPLADELEEYDRRPREHSRQTPEDLAWAAAELLVETDVDRIAGHLRTFRSKKFPGPIDPLLDLARHADESIASSALVALAGVEAPGDVRVRNLGLELLDSARWRGYAVALLMHNPGAGDWHLIERAFAATTGRETLHNLCLDVGKYARAHPAPEAERSLIAIYENAPCDLCRSTSVRQLIALGRLPDRLRAECRYDSNSATREAVSIEQAEAPRRAIAPSGVAAGREGGP